MSVRLPRTLGGICLELEMGLLVDLDTAVQKHALAKAELNELRRKIERQETALRVVYTWAGFSGALVPIHVRELTGKALGIEPAAQQRVGGGRR